MINSINNVSQVNNVQNLRKNENVSKVSQDVDSIDVSAEAKEIYFMEKVAKETPDVRADRIAEIKEKIKDPNYLNDTVINSAADKFLSALGI